MIQRIHDSSFRHRRLKRLYQDDDRSKLSADMVDKIATILAAVDRPSFRLHPLKGNRDRQWAVTVRANWRIVFRFEDGNVCDVDLVDYH